MIYAKDPPGKTSYVSVNNLIQNKTKGRGLPPSDAGFPKEGGESEAVQAEVPDGKGPDPTETGESESQGPPVGKVSQPGDAAELEADRVAESITQTGEITPVNHETGPAIHTKPLEAEPLPSEVGGAGKDQANERPEPENAAKSQSGKEPRPIRTKKAMAAAAAASDGDPGLGSRIDGLKGKGDPLPEGTREFFETQLNQDFGQVRIHNDPQSHEIARSLQARAFTIGEDVGFGAGEFAPQTGAGKKLLAHELTHVMQQGEIPQIRRKEKDFEKPRFAKVAPLDQAVKDKIFSLDPKLLKEFMNITGISWGDVLSVGVLGVGIAENMMKRSVALAILDQRLKEYDLSVTDLFQFIIAFQVKAVAKAEKLIFDNRKIVREERERYLRNTKDEKSQEGAFTGLYQLLTGSYAQRFKEADLLRARALGRCLKKHPGYSVGSAMGGFLPFPINLLKDLLGLFASSASEEKLVEFIAKFPPDLAEIAVFILENNNPVTTAMTQIIDPGSVYREYPEFKAAREKENQAVTRMRTVDASVYPILADVNTDFRSIARKFRGNPAGLQQEIMNILGDREEKAHKTLGTLYDNPSKVWELVPLIQLTMIDENIFKEDKTGQLIWDRVEDVERANTFRSIGLAAMGIVLGIAGFFTGGATWAALAVGAGGAIVSGIDLYFELSSYQLHSNAAQATLGGELSDDPGILGVTFAVIGLVADVASLGAAGLKMVKSAAKAIKETEKSTEVAAEAGKLYDELAKAGKVGKGVSRSEFIKIIQDAKAETKLLPKELAEFDKLIKTVKIEVSPLQRTGWMKIFKEDPATCAKILGSFKDRPEVLARLSQHVLFDGDAAKGYTTIYKVLNGEQSLKVMEYLGREGAGSAQEILKGMNLIRDHLGEELLKRLMQEYFLKSKNLATMRRWLSLPSLSRMDAADFAKISKDIGDSKSLSKIESSFRQGVREAAVGHLYTSGENWLDEFMKMGRVMDNKTSGSIFEGLVRRVSKEPWGKVEGGIRNLEANSFPDGIVDIGSGWKIGEFKFSMGEGEAFTKGTDAYKRLAKYAELMIDNIQYQGKPIMKIKVIFSSKGFAQKNKSILEVLFGRNVEIYYITKTLQEGRL